MDDDSITKAEDQDWMVPIISCLKILVAVQRGIFGVWHSNMFFNGWWALSLNPRWGKFMKALVVYINRHPRWSGCLEEPVFITLPWCLIVSSSIRGVKNVNGLVICSWCLLRWCILLSNNGFSGVEEWSSLVRLINPPSSKVHCFVLVAIDYFTKQTKAVSLKNMIHNRGNNL